MGLGLGLGLGLACEVGGQGLDHTMPSILKGGVLKPRRMVERACGPAIAVDLDGGIRNFRDEGRQRVRTIVDVHERLHLQSVLHCLGEIQIEGRPVKLAVADLEVAPINVHKSTAQRIRARLLHLPVAFVAIRLVA